MPGTETKEILYISGKQEPISPSEQLQLILRLCDGVFTDQFIFGHMGGGGLDGSSFSSRNRPLCLLWFGHKIVNNCKSVLSKGILLGASPGIISNTRQGIFARLLMVQFTSNKGMSNDASYVNTNVRKTTMQGTTVLYSLRPVCVKQTCC